MTKDNSTANMIICAALQFLTKNEDAWGNMFAALLCGICSAAGGKAAVDQINSARALGKRTAKTLNKAKSN